MILSLFFTLTFYAALSTLADCPLYRPTDSSGAQRDWTCEEAVCAYPGLTHIKRSGAEIERFRQIRTAAQTPFPAVSTA